MLVIVAVTPLVTNSLHSEVRYLPACMVTLSLGEECFLVMRYCCDLQLK